MSRAERLLDLLQALRRYRYPVSGRHLADTLGVSLRTVYRDIRTLVGQGAPIDGEPGLGYVLKPGFMPPPLMFSGEEIESLVLGARWVARHGDGSLAAGARDALAKIAAVLPEQQRDMVDTSGLLAGPGQPVAAGGVDLGPVRRAIRDECKVCIRYADANGTTSERIIWPIALAFFDHGRVVAAWCEHRRGFRHFRVDRIVSWTWIDERYPRRRRVLTREWRESEGVPEPI
jgi:predicted DNA-binding transcriptional regulator YafY